MSQRTNYNKNSKLLFIKQLWKCDILKPICTTKVDGLQLTKLER